jgi:hypothetical protein
MFSGSKIGCLGALLCAAILAGCASAPATHVERDPQASLPAYRTFAFYREPGVGRAQYTTIVGNRLEQSTRAQLQRLGYVYDESSPDLRVNIVLKVQERQDLRSTPARGPAPYRYWGPASVETVNYRQGTLAIDIVDARRNAMVWRGVAQDRISKKDMQNSGETIDAVVRELFASYPRQAAT